jgi:hypothetical protein
MQTVLRYRQIPDLPPRRSGSNPVTGTGHDTSRVHLRAPAKGRGTDAACHQFTGTVIKNIDAVVDHRLPLCDTDRLAVYR